MKRQALGKGLGALIPEKNRFDPLSSSGTQAPAKGAKPVMRDTGPSRTSAADIHVDRASETPESHAEKYVPAASSTAPVGADEPLASGTLPGNGSRLDADAITGGTTVSPPAAGSGAFQWIDVDRIRPNPLQPRRQFEEGRIEELAASIRSSGILQPVIVRKVEDGYSLVAGERRWRAAQKAGLLKVPALVREVPHDRVLEIALIENLQREDLNPMEEARAYHSLIEDFGLTQAEVGERVGRQRSTIANSLRLLMLSPKVQGLVESGALTMGHARALVGLPGHRAQDFGATQIVSRGLSVREAEAWVSRHTEEPPEPHRAPPRDPNVAAAEQGLQRHLGTRIRIVPGRGEKGRIVIEYYSAAELDRLYERLSRS